MPGTPSPSVRRRALWENRHQDTVSPVAMQERRPAPVPWAVPDGNSQPDQEAAFQEYGDEIFWYLRYLEMSSMADPGCISKQSQLEGVHREELVEYLAETASNCDLMQETVFCGVGLVDRFLSIVDVPISDLQVLGVTALFTAAKFCETDVPSAAQMVTRMDGLATSRDIRNWELRLLQTIGFRIPGVTPVAFLRRLYRLAAAVPDVSVRHLAEYLAETSLLEEGFIACAPSLVAASSLWLACMLRETGDWSPDYVELTGHSLEVLVDCAERLRLGLVTRKGRGASLGDIDDRHPEASAFMERYVLECTTST
jgi:hypothetical protein